MSCLNIKPYFPQFLWKFWLLEGGPAKECSFDTHRVHVYDVYENNLTELRRIPFQPRTIFHDFQNGTLGKVCEVELREAEQAFARLEGDVEHGLTRLVHDVQNIADTAAPGQNIAVPVEPRTLLNFRKFFTFLRYRNSTNYDETLGNLGLPDDYDDAANGMRQMRRRQILRGFRLFLGHKTPSDEPTVNQFRAVHKYCWRLCNADVCLGLGSEGNEFVISDNCYGLLDETFRGDRECPDSFFPITPRLALYMLADSIDRRGEATDQGMVPIECGFESRSDVHLRNASILESYPSMLYFSSLSSVVLSIGSYEEFRLTHQHMDYSRLRQRCRQKHTQESLMKTLAIRGSVLVTDLTDEVVRTGDTAVAHGTFSDVWKGVWTDTLDNTPRVVCIKYLRQVMVKNVRERLLKRLRDEVLAWHRLQHPNIAELYGVIQGATTVGMVSPWCENGSIVHYLQKINPKADRLELLVQIASAMAYLHTYKPVVVHGDLKGGNIVVNDRGQAVVTDFGLSKVTEELSDTLKLDTSSFAGSTRWMAPELVLALVEDDGCPPPISTSSDVYAFAAVCLEVVTDRVPYHHRTNDHSVTVDILKGIRPSRRGCDPLVRLPWLFWAMLDHCWACPPNLRPSMSEMTSFLVGLETSSWIKWQDVLLERYPFLDEDTRRESEDLGGQRPSLVPVKPWRGV
ncbi:hypothetical protein PLICRDRAFT_117229 [Plicaturopsis crispa FD-325 SS-3]|uniref:Protein kinase domain-containing protein n=1 Tax=Plicaturopsis crispa FD-325 SS-3 TaxID=944288 RepID=A0A0C9SL32_PLICR|nr:hypothetical protein PLICRDRAFT_117229 [Plicaturopsis crispa FD-325 SS-3]